MAARIVQGMHRKILPAGAVELETTYSSVEQIALMCGYQDTGTFRRLFVKGTGELPAAYREHYRLRTSRKRWRGTRS